MPWRRSVSQAMRLALQDAQMVESLDGDVNEEQAPVYGVDYSIGDICDEADPKRGLLMAKRCLEVEHIDEPAYSAISPKFGKRPLNTRGLIAKEIKR